MLLRVTIIIILCFLQMLPWIGEMLFAEESGSVLLWGSGAVISLSAMLLLIHWSNERKLSVVQFGLSGWRKRTMVYGFLIGLLAYGSVFGIRLALGAFDVTGAPSAARIAVAIAGSLLMTLYIAFTEEVIFRGVIFTALRQNYSLFLSVAGSLSLFILFHLPKWESLWSSPYLFHLIASGLVFTVAYIRSNTLWHSVALHWGWNMGAFALVENKATVVVIEQHSSYGWSDPAGWVSAAVHIVLLVVMIYLVPMGGRTVERTKLV